MPKLFLKNIVIIGLIVYWFNGLITPPVLAATDPIAATSSATATVPATLPTTSDNQAPTIPILVRPVDGTITGDNRPEFVWRRSSDPNGNTVTYTLYINDIATYLGISNIGNSSGANYTSRIDDHEIKLLPTVSLPEGDYTWYVSASDTSGNSVRSVLWDFTIDTTGPPLTLFDLDTYHLPSITEGSNFDITGPKDIHFTLLSDPFIDTQITITSTESDVFILKSSTNSQGLSYLYQHLTPGLYTVSIVVIDRANNATALPQFSITITQAQITVPLPDIPGLAPTFTIPYTPYSLPSLPATIAKLETRLPLAYIWLILLAIAILILIVFIWKRRPNLYLLESTDKPVLEATIYHSIPTNRSRYSPILVTKHSPISYLLSTSDQGQLYIDKLGRYSTLTIRTDNATYVLSISGKRLVYTVKLG